MGIELDNYTGEMVVKMKESKKRMKLYLHLLKKQMFEKITESDLQQVLIFS